MGKRLNEEDKKIRRSPIFSIIKTQNPTLPDEEIIRLIKDNHSGRPPKEFHLVDKIGRILWISKSEKQCLDLLRVLTANPEEVSETDEIKWESVLRTAEFIEPLTVKPIFKNERS